MGGSTTQVTKNETDPDIKRRLLEVNDRARVIADSPFQAYTAPRVAELSPTQNYVKGLLQNVVDGNVGGASLNNAISIFDGLSNYSAPQITSQGLLSAPQVSAGQLKDTDLSAYMNPYTQNVIDTSLADLARARDVQRVNDNQSATAARAFGGSRHGVADSLTNEDYLRNVASTTANLRNTGYQNAQTAALADIANRYNADTFNAGNTLATDQFNANLDFNRQSQNAANDITSNQMRANIGTALSQISNQELQQALQRAGALASFGDLEYDISQRKLDTDYAEFIRQLNDPLIKQQILQGSAAVLPNDGTQTTTTKQSMGLGQILGGVAGLGLTAATGGLFGGASAAGGLLGSALPSAAGFGANIAGQNAGIINGIRNTQLPYFS